MKLRLWCDYEVHIPLMQCEKKILFYTDNTKFDKK